MNNSVENGIVHYALIKNIPYFLTNVNITHGFMLPRLVNKKCVPNRNAF